MDSSAQRVALVTGLSSVASHTTRLSPMPHSSRLSTPTIPATPTSRTYSRAPRQSSSSAAVKSSRTRSPGGGGVVVGAGAAGNGVMVGAENEDPIARAEVDGEVLAATRVRRERVADE